MSAFYFRPLAVVLVGCLGAITTVNLLASLLATGPPNFPERLAPPASFLVDRGCLAQAISFERTDLKIACALLRTDQALASSPQASVAIEAQTSVLQALGNAPYDSRLWLALAMLKSRAGQPMAAALKMSYLTAPNAVEIIPFRLAYAVADNSLIDADLRQLAAGDIRLILTKRPDLKRSLVDAYRQASTVGKNFLEEKISAFDPTLISSLGLK